MYRLKTLGGIDLRSDDGSASGELLAQPKRVALLACLAVQPGGYLRRDTLLALLWPDLDTDRARHALRQTVYLLRRALGTGVIVSRGEEDLGLDPGLFQCDAAEFCRLVAEGKSEEALAYYGGEFLPGFHLPGASGEFEDWLAEHRREMQAAAISAALAQVQQRRQAGELARATEVARWAATQDPLNELVHSVLVELLGARGDAAGARRVYNALTERLLRDLGSEPSPGTREALARAEAVPTVLRPGPVAPPHPVAASAPEVAAAAGPARPPEWRRWALAALLPALALVAWLAPGSGRGVTPPALAVGDIRQLPVPADSTEQLPIADLLATSLARLRGTQVLSAARLTEVRLALTREGQSATAAAIARAAGARDLLEGSVYRVGEDSLVLELRRVDLHSGRVLEAYRVGAREVFGLVDRATGEFARAAGVSQPAEGIADVTTRSLVAFKLYQEGLRSYYASEPGAARRFFQSAVDEDTTFAMATWYLARTEQILDMPSTRARYLSALRLAAGASERERLLITADVAGRDSRYLAARAVAETLVARYPLDPDASLTLGHLVVAARDYLRAVALLRRTIALDSAVQAHPGPACRQCDAYASLVGLELDADSLSRALLVAREFVTRIPDAPRAWEIQASVLWQSGDSVGAREAEARLARLQPGQGRGAGIAAATVASIARGAYERAEQDLLALDRTDERARDDARWYLNIVLRNQGRLREARALAAGGPRWDPRWAGLDQRPDSIGLLVVDLELGVPATCLVHTRGVMRRLDPWLLANWPGHALREQRWALARRAMCEAAAGDTAALAVSADSLELLGRGSGFARDERLYHYARGLLWKARGRPDEAIGALRAAISSPTFGFTQINLELGRLLLERGRPTEAVAILAPALRGALDASNLYVSRTELHEALARAWDAANQPDSARVHWEAVVHAWRTADPMFRERRAAAERRLVALSRP